MWFFWFSEKSLSVILLQYRCYAVAIPQLYSCWARVALAGDLLVHESSGRSLIAEAALAIGFIVTEVPIEPLYVAIALKGQYMGANSIQKPAIVRDDHYGSREIQYGLFQSS